MKQDCDTCKHNEKNWDDLPCDGCCTAHSGYEAGMNREEAIRCLSVHSSTNGSGLCTDEQHYEAKQMALKALEREPILDKIRAEIETKYGQCDICEYFEENDISEYRGIGDIADILQIIDKYKAESEE